MSDGWKAPSNIIAALSLLVSIIAIFIGIRDQNRIVELESSKLDLEREMNSFRKEIETSINQIKFEIDELNKQIESHESDISRYNDGLLVMKGQLQMYENLGQEPRAEAMRKNIILQQNMIDTVRSKLEPLTQRRRELEEKLQNYYE